MMDFKLWKKINANLLLQPARLSFITEEEIKTFHEKQKLKQFMTTEPVLQTILKGTQHTKKKEKYNQENMEKINLTNE
jgi:hypothetical protein